MKLQLNVLSRPRVWAGALTGALALLVTACGGGNEIFPPVAPPPVAGPGTVPPSATASPTAYTSFVASLAPSEVEDPLLLPAVDAPTSETDEPLPVN